MPHWQALHKKVLCREHGAIDARGGVEYIAAAQHSGHESRYRLHVSRALPQVSKEACIAGGNLLVQPRSCMLGSAHNIPQIFTLLEEDSTIMQCQLSVKILVGHAKLTPEVHVRVRHDPPEKALLELPSLI